jgi:hypothetical protein
VSFSESVPELLRKVRSACAAVGGGLGEPSLGLV